MSDSLVINLGATLPITACHPGPQSNPIPQRHPVSYLKSPMPRVRLSLELPCPKSQPYPPDQPGFPETSCLPEPPRPPESPCTQCHSTQSLFPPRLWQSPFMSPNQPRPSEPPSPRSHHSCHQLLSLWKFGLLTSSLCQTLVVY